jgi:redox-sensitive bicupin YhaK (pirin superfamily)
VIDVRDGRGRFRTEDRAAGVETWHAFSFGGHYDPDNVGFGLLRAVNEECLAVGAGFAEHPHRDTEIVTWVLEGELEHRDGEGRTARLGPGGLQRLSAGGGIRHVERNGGRTPLRFLQMWLRPDVFGGAPGYTAADGPAPPGPGLRLLASGAADSAPAVRLRQRAAALYAGRPAAADSCELPAAPFVYVHVVRGAVRVGGQPLGPGDAARLTGEAGVRAGTDGPAEYLVWEMHGEPSYE